MKKFLFLWGPLVVLVLFGFPEKAHSQYLYRPTPYTYLFNTNATAAEARAYLGVSGSSGGTFTNGTFVDGIFSGGSFSMQTNTDLTASRALVSDSAKRITNSAVTSTELGYVSGVTSAIQSQINAKGTATNGTFSGGTFAGATNTNPQIVGGTASQLAISGQAVVTSTNASITPFVIVGAAGQTANAFTIQTNGGTVQMLVTKEGAMGIGGASTSYKLQITGAGAYNTLGGCAIGMHNTTASQIWAQAAHNDTAFFWQDVTGNQTKMSIYPGANGALDFYTGTGYTTINGTGGLKIGGKSYIGGTSNPQYQLDVNGQARLIGTNGVNFGGTSGASDHGTTLYQVSSGRLLHSGSLENVGNMNVGFYGAGSLANFHVKGAGASAPLAILGTTGNSPTNDLLQIHRNGTNLWAVDSNFTINQSGTITAAGTTGNQTINKPIGSVNLAAAATSLVVTCSAVGTAANTIVLLTVGSNDTTCKSAAVVVGTGQFTIHPNAAPTAETVVFFEVKRIK